MCEFLRVRFTPADAPEDAAFLMRHDVHAVAFDMRHAALSVSATALDASGGVVCSVTRTVRVLQTLPCVALQTIDVARAPSSADDDTAVALFIDHLVRAPPSSGGGGCGAATEWTFDGSLYNNNNNNNNSSSASSKQHFVLSATSSSSAGGGCGDNNNNNNKGMMLAAAYLGLEGGGLRPMEEE
jgi:hypothetical protein